AFIGTFGLGIAQLRSLGLLCFVEANSAVAPLLQDNVAEKASCPTAVVQALLTGSGAETKKRHCDPGNLGSMSFDVGDDTDTSGTVRALTLADLRTQYGSFDLIKLDIEGMELEALQGDADFLAKGYTTLWLEANENSRSLDVARLLLSWNLKLYYFAFPAFNSKNFNRNPEVVFPFAFEAGLLAAPKAAPSLSQELEDAGCILKHVRCIKELKDALWRTPRWGMVEWQSAANMQELAALMGRAILGETFAAFLSPDGVAAQGRTTIWQRLETEQVRREQAEVCLETEQVRRQQAEVCLETEQVRRQQAEVCLEAEQVRRQQAEENLRVMTALAAEQKEILDRIENSTAWRATGVLRRFISRRPALHASLRKMKDALRSVLRQWQRRSIGEIPPTMAVSDNAAPTDDFVHREAVRAHFDADYYLTVNQDVQAAGVDPLDHFIQQGWREGRNPSPVFDVEYYLQANRDVATANVNPLVHYVVAGMTEGRLPQSPFNTKRQHLARLVSLRTQAADWAGAADRSAALSSDVLATVLNDQPSTARIVVSVSHDDYAIHSGGIQNVIADEQRAFEEAGWLYFHVSPAEPLPVLADEGTRTGCRLRLRLNGKAVGVVQFGDLNSVLTELCERGTKFEFIFHHLLGHRPDLLGKLATTVTARPIKWVHDFFTLCPKFTLMRNDIKFCGAPSAGSAACTVCMFGDDRRDHLPRMGAFFEIVRPMVLAPSAVALDFWKSRGGYLHTGSKVVPPARLTMTTSGSPTSISASRPLRIAHLGGAYLHKGWDVFQQLALAYASDHRYEFYHLAHLIHR
ncbi:MAG: FkbM family methyltransferase, partial [Rhodopila sp.]